MANETVLAASLLAEKFSPQVLQQAQQQAAVTSVASTATYPQSNTTTYPQATNTNANVMNNGEPSSEPVQAYAKLEGDSFCYYIRTLQVTFGRKASSSDQVDIHLGPTKAISRQHARLFYNFTTQRFEMMVFGKNGAFVNEQFIEKGATVALENRTKIQIGEVSFSFLLPKIETDDNSHDNSSRSNQNGDYKKDHGGGGEHFDSSEYSSKDTKPPFSYASLIAQAINSTPSRKLTLNGIYQHITNHYPYYQLAQNGWQNSIRHNLSLNKAFVKVPRADSEPGKGAFWTIDQSCENQFANGVYKRNRRSMSTKPGGGARARSDSESPMDSDRARKRPNVGDGDTSQLSSPQPSQPSTPRMQESVATALQGAPSNIIALNLANLTQSINASNKDGTQNALASALLAANNSNNSSAAQNNINSTNSAAMALVAHLKQQQLLQQQQQLQSGGSPTSGASSPQSSNLGTISQQSLSNLQAVAAAGMAAAAQAQAQAQAQASAAASATASATSSPIPSAAATTTTATTAPTTTVSASGHTITPGVQSILSAPSGSTLVNHPSSQQAAAAAAAASSSATSTSSSPATTAPATDAAPVATETIKAETSSASTAMDTTSSKVKSEKST